MLAFCLTWLASPAQALAQTSAGNKAAAEALFDEGRTLMQQEKYEEACKKLEASQALDVGLGTLMLLSDCYEKLGKTASAWASFKDAAAAARTAGDSGREEVARARAEALEPNLAKALVQASDKTRALGGLEVKMNGQPIPIAQLGTPVPIDPGELTVTATAAGYEPWEITVKVVEGASETTIDIPDLQAAEQTAAAPAQAPAADEPAAPIPAATPQDPAVDDSSSNLQTIGLVVGAAGVVGIAVGSYFGLQAMSKNDQSKKKCFENNVCPADGFELREDAKSAATVSNITFGLGAALLATGVVLYVVAPDDAGETVSVSARPETGGAHLSLEGTW